MSPQYHPLDKDYGGGNIVGDLSQIDFGEPTDFEEGPGPDIEAYSFGSDAMI